MQRQSGKFLLDFIDGLTRQQIFFGFWVGIGLFFLFIFWRQYQRTEQRNFRDTKPGPKKGTALVVSEDHKKMEVRKVD